MAELILRTESLDFNANAIAHHEGKVFFVRGALAGELVRTKSIRSKPKYEVAQTVEVLEPSALRVQPACPHFEVCGGCSMQHLDPRAQVSVKARTLEDNLWHLARVKPESILSPIVGQPWGYRYRARLSVKNVLKKGSVLVGFHEKNSSFIADMTQCLVMPDRVSSLLVPLRRLVEGLSIRSRLPQIEVAYNDDPGDGRDVLALALRILDPLSSEDRQVLNQFAMDHRVEFWLQTKGPETVYFMEGQVDAKSRLQYRLPEFDVSMPFKPTDFTQVNHRINSVLVRRALRLLDVQMNERVLDLFCGLGNFTLPLARRAKQVIGIEGAASLVVRARENAKLNHLEQKATFAVANLFDFSIDNWMSMTVNGNVDKLLIDPPREGALAVANVLSRLAFDKRPQRVVYVSCNPATLARDCAILVHQGGWVLKSAGVVNMFPHTSHVESIAVFESLGASDVAQCWADAADRAAAEASGAVVG